VKVLFGIFVENTFLEISKKASRRDWGASKLLMGDPPRVAGQGGGAPWCSTWHSHMAYSFYERDIPRALWGFFV